VTFTTIVSGPWGIFVQLPWWSRTRAHHRTGSAMQHGSL